MDDEEEERGPRRYWFRAAVALSVAMAFCFGVYLLLTAAEPSGLISFTFLLILPAAVSAFVAYVADPWGEKSVMSYALVPVWLLLIVIVASFVLLREGVICIVMLSPLWLASGLAGVAITYRLRTRLESGRKYCLALLVAPLIAMQIEPLIPLPSDTRTVSRSIVMDAAPERIWPLLRGIADVRTGEGQWNVSQDIIGIPRPRGAQLLGDGIGAERLARWERDIAFREVITDWKDQGRIGWRFIFDDNENWQFTDRHLMPDSPYFRVTEGGYSMEQLGPSRTRLVLETSYWMRTPVNGYSALWGELFLGDLENNLLALVKQRAERKE